MASGRSAVVAGGTGLVGASLLPQLGANEGYTRVTSLVRREVSAPLGVTSHEVDFEQLDTLALPQVDDAFCCLGTTRRAAGSDAAFRRVDFDYIVAFARLAKRAGARRFLLVSSVGASPRSRFLYPRTKGECEAAITAIGFTTLVIVRPSVPGRRARSATGWRSGGAAHQLPDSAAPHRSSPEVRAGGGHGGGAHARPRGGDRTCGRHDHRVGRYWLNASAVPVRVALR